MELNIKTVNKIANCFKQVKVENTLLTKPIDFKAPSFKNLRLALDSDCVELSQKVSVKKPIHNFSKKEIMEIKPSQVRKILAERTDIDDSLRELVDDLDKLKLYDETQKALKSKKLSKEQENAFFSRLIRKRSMSEAAAQAEVVPELIKKGHDPSLVSELLITEYNKNQIENILNNKEIVETYVNVKFKNQIEETTRMLKRMNFPEEKISKRIEEDTIRYKKQPRIRLINDAIVDITRYIDDKNIKYLDACIKTTGEPRLLSYWKPDTTQIVEEFLQPFNKKMVPLDRIMRRGHTYESVKKIADDKPLNEITEKLLEFRNFEKFKEIDLHNFKNLTVQEQKEFINSFICAIAPKEANNDRKLITNINELSSKMKIFKQLDTTTEETFKNSYFNTIRSMLESIPENEQKLITKRINYGDFRANYRKNNPIPPLTNDLSTLPTSETIINGKKVKIAKVNKDTELSVATHRIPDPKAVLNIQALEITDPNEILCIGLGGNGKSNLNFRDDCYSLAIKPRLANDWYLQAHSDIDSGNHAAKNIFNLDKSFLRSSGNHASQSTYYIQELLKNELNLSQIEYTKRLKALKGATTLEQVKKIDPKLEQGIRKIIKENPTYEGLVRPEVMGVCVSTKTPLAEIDSDIINYCQRKNIPLIQITESVKPPIKMELKGWNGFINN